MSEAFLLLGDWKAAAEAAEDGLELYPEDTEILWRADVAYHDHLFDFSRAFELNQRRLKLDDSTGARLDFAERHLTTARFRECLARWAEFKDGEIDEKYLTARDGLRFACEVGAGELDSARKSAQVLLKTADNLSKADWTFAGTKHFVSTFPAFSAASASWVKLFESLEQGDGPGLAEAVRAIQRTFRD
jgi:hypothetical protein